MITRPQVFDMSKIPMTRPVMPTIGTMTGTATRPGSPSQGIGIPWQPTMGQGPDRLPSGPDTGRQYGALTDLSMKPSWNAMGGSMSGTANRPGGPSTGREQLYKPVDQNGAPVMPSNPLAGRSFGGMTDLRSMPTRPGYIGPGDAGFEMGLDPSRSNVGGGPVDPWRGVPQDPATGKPGGKVDTRPGGGLTSPLSTTKTPVTTAPTTTTTPQPTTPSGKPILPGWGYFTANEVDQANAQGPKGQEFLEAMRKYDPNAKWEYANSYGMGEGNNQTMVKLNFDASKLPGGKLPGMVDMNEGAYDGMYNDGTSHGYKGNLYKPDAVTTDPNGYGRVTDPRNMNLGADHYSAVDRYGPAVIAMLASLGTAAPALMAGNATMGSFSTGMGGALTNGITGAARAIGNGGGLESLAPMAISMGGGALGVPGYATSGANAALQYWRQTHQRPPGG